jgi:hypothetical protein
MQKQIDFKSLDVFIYIKTNGSKMLNVFVCANHLIIFGVLV